MFRSKIILVPFCLLAVVLCLPISQVIAADLDDSREKLQAIERRLRQTSKNLEEKERAENQVLTDLQSVRIELSRIRERDVELGRELREIEGKASTKEKEAEDARRRVKEKEIQVNARLVALYKSGDAGPLKVLFSSTTPSEMARQFRYLSRVVRYDRQLLDDYRQRLDHLDQALLELERLRASRQTLHADLQSNRQQLESADKIKRKLLARLREDKEALAATLAELRDRKARLEKLVKKLESPSSGEYIDKSGLFSATKGRLSWPLKGRVLVGFGTRKHPELGTLYSSNGIEIEADSGQPISAVGEGRVVFANVFQGYGKLVIVDHGESYHSLYGNAVRLKVKVGDRVEPGDILAYAGYPGTGGLYFEIRHHGVPLDPMLWIQTVDQQASRRKK